ncbi:MAG: histone deacetylase [Planctomycetes bacterium]|nr:histone deacetylase [Planctomycetota bacterium]
MKIFYRPEQTALKNADCMSPSAQKPAQVVASWLSLHPTADLIGFEPLTRTDLALAHDRNYVNGVLDLEIPNGFGNKLPEIADSLLYTTGSFYAAACHAFTTKESAASPTSGFHHAGYDSGGGFCTFNGLMIAAQKLRQEQGAASVGILDLDRHYGDGTDDITWRLGLENYIVHYTFGGERITQGNAEEWLQNLPGILDRFAACDVVLYQAGADPHVHDPLGGILTTEQLYERDRIVFRTFLDLGVPVAWNLAGGYQKPLRKVLDIHDNTARAFVAAFG